MSSPCENSDRIMNLEERMIGLSSRLERIDVNTEHLIKTNDRLAGIMENLEGSINKLDVTLVKVINTQEHDREAMISIEAKLESELYDLKQRVSEIVKKSEKNEELARAIDEKTKFDFVLWIKKNFGQVLMWIVLGAMILENAEIINVLP